MALELIVAGCRVGHVGVGVVEMKKVPRGLKIHKMTISLASFHRSSPTDELIQRHQRRQLVEVVEMVVLD